MTRARDFGVDVLNVLVRDVETPVILHACYGYSLYASEKSPMRGGAPAIDQAGLGQDKRPGTDQTDGHTARMLGSEPL